MLEVTMRENEYFELLVLAYFRQYKNEYSISDISNNIGISEIFASDLILDLVNKGELKYNDDLLRITVKGRNRLCNSSLESYSFDADLGSIFLNKRWDKNKVYVPHEFSKYRWRGKK